MVITIIGILVGLLMPAVMSAIEAAAAHVVREQHEQIALAANQYETSHGNIR